ncbi:MAG: AAC(3) family N-acetyltransferase [Chloroflexi bacterium]|nr:AAC(3) family N-acetyltransferase [Chloroflexota bacterium]
MIVSSNQLVEQLLDIGVTPGGVLLVHGAFSRVKPVANGPIGLIAALRAALGATGTLVMPSMTDDEDIPFDPQTTPCLDMGIVAHTFWQLPDVLRSDSPHAFAAVGPYAPDITAPHPVTVPHGLDSPVGRVYEQDGQVLLLGVGHSENTTIHLAEFLAGMRYRLPKHVLIREGERVVRVEYGEIDHCCENFALADGWLDSHGLQRRGQVGHAAARLMRARDVVAVVMAQLRQNETIFLHPPGVDEECDEARASLLPSRRI